MTEEQAGGVLTTIDVDGGVLTLRYMGAADHLRMLAFARSLPPHDLLFLRRDITDPAEVDAWMDDIATGEVSTILAVRDDDIVGYAAVARSPLSWMRHIAELRVLVGEPLRGKGLGRALTREAFRVAVDMGVEKMIAQMTIDQQGAMSVFRRLGFQSEALLPGHVKDRDGKTYDLVVMSQSVTAFQATLDSLGSDSPGSEHAGRR